MHKLLIAAAACFAAFPAIAASIYGNDGGCRFLRGESLTDDTHILIQPDRISSWESVCDLPAEVDYSGAPMTVICTGEGEEWTETTALIEDAEAGTLTYGSHVLRRCD